MLRPPRELGSEAFSHAQSGIEPPAIALKVSLIASSKTEMASLIWLGGQHLSGKATFGSARHDLSSVVSNCESSRSGSLDKAAITFSTLFNSVASQKEGGPIGDPSRLKPSEVVGMSDGRGLQELSSSLGMTRRDFASSWTVFLHDLESLE